MTGRTTPMLLVLGLLAACGEGAAPVAEPDPTPPPAVVTALAPSPYTAQAIREATPAGRAYVFRVEADGAPKSFRRMEFVAVDERGATIRTSTWREGDEPTVEGEQTATWAQLVAHAAYPADRTLIRPAEVEVPAGLFAAKLYEVRDEQHIVTTRAWFADDLPGAPVRLEEWDGRTLKMAMTLVEHIRP